MGDSGRDIEAEQAFTENTQYAFRRVVELEAEVASLRAIVDRLPKWADTNDPIVSPFEVGWEWTRHKTPRLHRTNVLSHGWSMHRPFYKTRDGAIAAKEAAEAAHRAQEIHDD